MRIENKEGMSIVYPEGRIDIATAGDFKNSVMNLIERGDEKIILDFSDVSAIDSSGLGKLLMFQKKLKEKGGELRIQNVSSEYVKKIFSLVHLYKVINIEGLSG